MKAIILAGGQATRLWPLTEDFAKPLLIIKGLPIISHIVANIPENIECLVSTNLEFKKDFSFWAEKYHPERKIKIFIEKVPVGLNKLGALRAISYAIQENKIRDDLLVIAADNFITFKIADFIKKFSKETLVAAYDIENRIEAKNFGVLLVDKRNNIIEFAEKPTRPKSTLVSTACYVIPQKYFSFLGEIAEKYPDNIGVFVEKFLEKRLPVQAFRFTGNWYDIGSYEAYLELHKKEPSQIINTKLIKNSQFFGSVFIDVKTKIRDSVIVNSVIMEKCLIENCTLRDTCVAQGVTLKNIDLEKKVIPKNSMLIG